MDMRRMMSRQLSIIVWIAVLTVTINAIDNDRVKRNATEDNNQPEQYFISKEGILIGERTPVWFASNPHYGKPVVYSRMRIDTMKLAMIELRSRGHKTVKLDPAIDAYSGMKKKDVQKSLSSMGKVIHLSILVVMDYDMNWNGMAGLDKSRNSNYTKLIYAMGFWNSVDIRLRFIDPKVRIRIVGIVISDDRRATPYVYDNFSPKSFYDEEGAIMSMHKYWADLSATNDEFRKDAYDCIVTLNDLRPRAVINHGFANLKRTLLKDKFEILSLNVNDDMKFTGVNKVADELMEILAQLPLSNGGAATSVIKKKFDGAKPHLNLEYFSRDIKKFYDGLSKPKEHYKPGKPLETILPSHISPAMKQCTDTLLPFNNVCWDYTSCEHLMCSGEKIACVSIGPPTDGTTCVKDKMCLAGQCVSREIFPMH